MVDLTAGVASVVQQAGSVTTGIATVFVPGATAAVTTMENEPGNVFDLRALLDRLVPPGGSYQHNRLNHDTNALFFTQDAGGPLRHGMVLLSCITANLADAVALSEGDLRTLSQVSGVPTSTEINAQPGACS